jgi:hypothetical protein
MGEVLGSTDVGARTLGDLQHHGRLTVQTGKSGGILEGTANGGDIGKGHRSLVRNEHLRLALAEAHRLVVLALRAAHHEDEESANQQHGEEGADQQAEELS